MAHFDSVSLAPADPILSLTEAFKADSNPEKINLSVGVFVDDSGITPILPTVIEAERRLAANASSKSYLPITGSPLYGSLTQELCLGSDLKNSLDGQITTAQTPGGTGGLRVAADFIKKNLSTNTVWLSNPTWANHKGIFSSPGLEIKSYAYFDKASLRLDYAAFIEAIKAIPAGDIVVLHACCHNPTGADLSPAQWDEVATIATEKNWIPLLDFAYQGFGAGIDSDAHGVRAFAKTGLPLFIAQSFSKNFGLYQDRVGALHIITANADETKRVASQLKLTIRTNYSNPPAHGGGIVQTILNDQELYTRWEIEVAQMRSRIHEVRDNFVAALSSVGVSRDFSFLKEQKGMFSFTGLSQEQATALREDHSIYIVNDGRINVAGITADNLPRLAQAFKALLG